MGKKRLIFLGMALILAAIALTAYNLQSGAFAGEASQSALEVLRAEIPEVPQPAGTAGAEQMPAGIEASQPVYLQYPEMEMPALEVDGQKYLGILSIPKLGLMLPVLRDYTDEALRTAPCRYAGSAYESNLVIAGHNYLQHFARLYELSIGDCVQFTDADGNVFDYSVSEVEQLRSEEVERMVTGDWDLTLFTCTITRQHRIAVRCIDAAGF